MCVYACEIVHKKHFSRVFTSSIVQMVEIQRRLQGEERSGLVVPGRRLVKEGFVYQVDSIGSYVSFCVL